MITAKALLLSLIASGTAGDYSHIDADQAYCLALNVWHESGIENVEGQFAVAHATMARVSDPRFPNTICSVVLHGVPDPLNPTIPKKWRCAFSWNCDRKSDTVPLVNKSGTPNKQAIRSFTVSAVIALMAMNGEIDDFCDSSNFYYNPDLANPSWAKFYTQTCTIGNHKFMRREKGSLK